MMLLAILLFNYYVDALQFGISISTKYSGDRCIIGIWYTMYAYQTFVKRSQDLKRLIIERLFLFRIMLI